MAENVCPLCDKTLECGNIIAEFSSVFGGTCFRLYNKKMQIEALRTPKNEEDRLTNVYLFGNPLLFPPNRIRGGKFTFDGRAYELPVNEPSTGCFIHGDLMNCAFDCEVVSDNEIVFRYTAKSGEYMNFPHDFTIERHYVLNDGGLTEYTTIYNDGRQKMPVMLAYHTTFRLDFCRTDDLRLQVAVSDEFLRDDKFLPTGETANGRPRDIELCNGDYNPLSGQLSAFYKAEGNSIKLFNQIDLSGIEYEFDEHFGYRMLYRGKNDCFAALEPQTCATDCFHYGVDPFELGLIGLEGNNSITFKTKIGFITTK